MNNIYHPKATISYGNASVTVYEQTAQIINAVAITTMLCVGVLIIAKLID